MNAPERLPVVNAPIAGAVHLPCTLCVPSGTNPRHRLQDMAALQLAWKLKELAASIKNGGVLEPIIVRPRPDLIAKGVLVQSADGVYEPVADKLSGEALYEIVAGERRWRATQLAGLATVPAIIRVMTDFEVRSAQLVENDQREDLHPIEAGQGYKNMLRKPGETEGFANVDELAAHIGMSRRFVYNRIKLSELCPAARDAVYEGKISTSVALLLAGIDDQDQQAEAAAAMAAGWGGDPFTFRSAAEHLKKNYMLALTQATFDITSVYKVAGPCTQCTKRTGAKPDLFEELTGGDMCQDSKCYQAKAVEARTQLLDEARAAGHEIVNADEVKKKFPSLSWSQPPELAHVPGHRNMDRPAGDLALSNKPLREILGDGFTDTLVVDVSGADKPIELATEAAIKKALKAKGLLRPAAPKKSAKKASATPALKKPFTPKQLIERKAELAKDKFGELLFLKLNEVITADVQLPILALRLAVDELLVDISNEAADKLYAARGWTRPKEGTFRDLTARIERATARELGDLLVIAMVIEQCVGYEVSSVLHDLKHKKTECGASKIAKEYGVSLTALNDKATLEAGLAAKAEQEARLAEIEAAKPVTKKAAPLTPERALAQSVARAQEGVGGEAKGKSATGGTGGKATAAGKGKIQSQKDEAAKPPASASAATQSSGKGKETEQKDEAATPRLRPAVGEMWRVKPGTKRSKTAGRVGKVDQVTAHHVTLRWGPKAHELGVYDRVDLEYVAEAAPAAAKPGTITPAAAWPFPTGGKPA